MKDFADFTNHFRIKNSLPGVLTTLFLYGFLFFIQFALIYAVGHFLKEHEDLLQWVFFVVDLGVGLHIVNDRRNDPVYKVAFLFTMIVLPLFGAFLYILSKWDIMRRWFSEKFETSKKKNFTYYHQDPEIMEETRQADPLFYNTARFLWNQEDFPIYRNGACDYYASGEDYWHSMLQELEKAEKFIFMEYFIVQQGDMWDSILDILKRKAEAGVEVRLMYDGTAVLTKLPIKYPQAMEKLGIKTKVFKPLCRC